MSIAIENVTKRFGRTIAVDGLSLEVPPGQVFAFLGPNGAGKTTTIKMISGLLKPDSGGIRVCDIPVSTNGLAARTQLAYVPDQPFLYDKLTGREFLGFVGEMYRVPIRTVDKRVKGLSARLDIDYLDQLTEGYSHGMRQKVALLAALLHDPKVLVTDEPMVGLDPRTVRTVKNLLRELAEAGTAVFVSTHTLGVAEAIADRIGIIHHGRLITVGTLAELRQQARTESSLEDVFLALTEEQSGPNAETIPV
ncbi:MAG: ABC transporter ATP-binding protein [Phycisphaerae bacterium]|nr:ABC transporter ATP-binding protein [Phycisphaerae bacterium]